MKENKQQNNNLELSEDFNQDQDSQSYVSDSLDSIEEKILSEENIYID